jgi:predicted metalloprotease with PDZ domain
MRRTLLVLVPLLAASSALAAPPLRLMVDAREAPRHLLHGRLILPVTPGPLTLLYPKWLPGEHSPNGPINAFVGLHFTVKGRTLPWRRDPDDPFAFHLEVPAGATELEALYDVLPSSPDVRFSSGPSSTGQLALLSWNQLVLYPRGARAHDLAVSASLLLPAGWRFATALGAGHLVVGGATQFPTVSLEMLVDSPVLAGRILRTVDLSPGATPPHTLAIAGESAAAVAVSDDLLGHYRKLVAEAGTLFGGRPYQHYTFLLTLSDQVTHFGLEHHQSSDNRQPERLFLEEPLRVLGASLLPHEYVHSWNGKHRRPAGLATPDFEQPMHTELLWVYEGLTSYYGEVLAARTGLRTAEEAREGLALTAATLDASPGRTWRSLGDTAVAAPVLYGAPREWRGWRRGTDFYPESQLIWLEADTIIRGASHGQRSLDDFCRAFHGRDPGAPSVVPYTLEDVVAGLNEVAPLDWKQFFAARIDVPSARAPMGGLAAAGWNLVYRETPTRFIKLAEQAGKAVDLTFSLGLVVREDGVVVDVLPGTPAARAGLAPGMRLVAVSGRRFTAELLRQAVRETRTRPDVDLLAENGDLFTSHHLAYRGGARYPALERIAGRPDLLEAIYRSAAPSR